MLFGPNKEPNGQWCVRNRNDFLSINIYILFNITHYVEGCLVINSWYILYYTSILLYYQPSYMHMYLPLVSIFQYIIWLMDHVCIPGFLISLYGTPLVQRASYLALHSSLFGPDGGAVNYDYIITNSINSLLISSRCFPNGTHTNYCWANLAHASKGIKNSDVYVYIYISIIIITNHNVLIVY